VWKLRDIGSQKQQMWLRFLSLFTLEKSEMSIVCGHICLADQRHFFTEKMGKKKIDLDV